MSTPTSTTQPRTWLITGASSGLGKSLALAALNQHEKVIATTRDISKAAFSFPDFTALGGKWVSIDPGAPTAFEEFGRVSEEFGVDVLVNNAGYALIGGVEDTSESEVRDQMEVNFYGPLRAIKACLPRMRAQKSGEIVLISSGAGFMARPGRSSYSASKFAIEAVHEALTAELASFNIKVLIVEPGAFRTPFCSRIIMPAAHESTGGFSAAYKGTVVDQMLIMSRGPWDTASLEKFARGDPDKAGRVIVQTVKGGHGFLRLPLGSDCVGALEMKIGQLSGDLEASRPLAVSTDVD